MAQLEDRFRKLENRVASLEATSDIAVVQKLVGRVAGLEAWTAKSGSSTSSEPAAELSPEPAAEASPRGRHRALGPGGSAEDMLWRSNLEKWKSDLVDGLTIAAAELSRVQDQVGTLENRIVELQGTTSLSRGLFADSFAESCRAPQLSRPSSPPSSPSQGNAFRHARFAREVNVRPDETEPSIVSRVCRVESAMVLQFPSMRADVADIKAKSTSLMEDCTCKWRDMQAVNASIGSDVQYLMHAMTEINAKLTSKVEVHNWREANLDVDAHIKTLHDITCETRSDFQTWRDQVDDRLSSHYKDIRKLLVRASFCHDDNG